jgi:hypothetical protein
VLCCAVWVLLLLLLLLLCSPSDSEELLFVSELLSFKPHTQTWTWTWKMVLEEVLELLVLVPVEEPYERVSPSTI